MDEVSGRWFIDQEEPKTGGLVETLAVTGRFDLTDAQWAVLEPLLPKPKRSGRPSLWSRRRLIDGMRWRVRVGAPWRDVPATYGSCRRCTRYSGAGNEMAPGSGVLSALQCLADAAGRITWDVSVDSTIARAHQHAAGARKRGICRPSHPAGPVTSRPITRWVAPAAD